MDLAFAAFTLANRFELLFLPLGRLGLLMGLLIGLDFKFAFRTATLCSELLSSPLGRSAFDFKFAFSTAAICSGLLSSPLGRSAFAFSTAAICSGLLSSPLDRLGLFLEFASRTVFICSKLLWSPFFLFGNLYRLIFSYFLLVKFRIEIRQILLYKSKLDKREGVSWTYELNSVVHAGVWVG